MLTPGYLNNGSCFKSNRDTGHSPKGLISRRGYSLSRPLDPKDTSPKITHASTVQLYIIFRKYELLQREKWNYRFFRLNIRVFVRRYFVWGTRCIQTSFSRRGYQRGTISVWASRGERLALLRLRLSMSLRTEVCNSGVIRVWGPFWHF